MYTGLVWRELIILQINYHFFGYFENFLVIYGPNVVFLTDF
ncbi:hypothetical protein ENHAE0001_2605 [Enhydrobacter aerosaccus SK60]|nr:hypothetical protein ENHAE0001_2605 [Enhydrobacter aerosaccus SK60]